MADIFISYKREDQEEHGRVRPIAEALGAEGYDVFYDVQVPPGSSLQSCAGSARHRCATLAGNRPNLSEALRRLSRPGSR